ncbi:hypothetical protein ACFLYF_02660 [Chloroflexota bacterium]
MPYFDSERDRSIVEAGGFLCHACCVGKLANDQSPDPRYCQSCYDFLLKEVELGGHQKAKWRPDTPEDKAANAVPKLPAGETIQAGNNEVMAHTSKGDGGHCGGRPRLDLPVERIKALAGQGIKVPGILQQLREEGFEVSRRTVYRVLSNNHSLKVPLNT